MDALKYLKDFGRGDFRHCCFRSILGFIRPLNKTLNIREPGHYYSNTIPGLSSSFRVKSSRYNAPAAQP